MFEGGLTRATRFQRARGRYTLFQWFSSMSNNEFNKDVRELLIRTKVSTLLCDRPVVLLKQESTVELALQANPLQPHHCLVCPKCLLVRQVWNTPKITLGRVSSQLLSVAYISEVFTRPHN